MIATRPFVLLQRRASKVHVRAQRGGIHWPLSPEQGVEGATDGGEEGRVFEQKMTARRQRVQMDEQYTVDAAGINGIILHRNTSEYARTASTLFGAPSL